MTISVGVEVRIERKWREKQIDDGDGKSKRVDCTANIDIANSSFGPTFGSSKTTS